MKPLSQILTAVILSLSISSVFADEESAWKRFGVSMGRDENGNFKPEFSVSKHWGQHWFSQIQISQLTDSQVDELEDFQPSKRSTSFSEQSVDIKLMGYEWELYTSRDQQSYFSMALSYNYLDVNRTEFGYISLSIPELYDDWVAFDNNVDLIFHRASLSLDYFFIQSSKYKLQALANTSFYNSLDVSQEVEFRPLIDSVGTSSSSQEQDMAYEVGVLAEAMIISNFGVGISYKNAYRKFEYKAAVIASDLGSFEEQNINTIEKINNLSFKLLFGKFSENLRPTLSYSSITIDSEDADSENESNDVLKVVSLGLDGIF